MRKKRLTEYYMRVARVKSIRKGVITADAEYGEGDIVEEYFDFYTGVLDLNLGYK